ncbi:MAG: TIGR04283 family arsenosugar biosynthesis glycosyltransferase [Gemmatimonadaceae bacterium]
MPDDSRGRQPAVSIVVPTLDEERSIALLLGDLAGLAVSHEVIVVDGGSSDDTVNVATRLGARAIATRRGRGVQLATGAGAATAPVLCFLHADARLHDEARRELAQLVRSWSPGAFAFRFGIEAKGWRYRFIELGAHLRMRLFAMPYGDQGLVVWRAEYDRAGGYSDIPLMEDVALIDALRRVTTIRALRSTLPVSPRRWARDGPLTRMLRNWRIMIAYRLGACPHRLAARYRPLGDEAAAEPAPRSAGAPG